ncbi:hypothetical protein SAMN05216296_2825 [Pseudomonas pohangensis]|uniref:Uncharacterized protein n=1 Tax=Pseudomonas pohangensis TaxID=364197 RepID=A0A1H2H8F6_9PSED|nr:VPA1267 family protein [Pseudomonas pohangensis]SDU28096.1 hypothetical protein SAMN05216296_2825 [Pseudomonas pohangensis]
MVSGQQKAEQNLATFIAWFVSKSDDDFREYAHRGRLNRKEIAAECGFGKSALGQNPSIKKALEELEDRLRGTGVLLPPVAAAQPLQEEPPMRDREAKQRRNDGKRLNALEQENAALSAELAEAKSMLKQYNLLSSFMQETGRLPR